MKLSQVDLDTAKLISLEERRQEDVLEMIPSENYVSKAVMEAVGSVFMNKYAEGYPGKRYYQGNEAVDALERLAIERAKKLFGVSHVNVQPYSGSPANLEILSAICEPGDVVLSQLLSHGGHLSMGQVASMTSKFFKAFYYHMNSYGEIDWDDLTAEAYKHKPKIIFSGGTGYTRVFQWEKYAKAASDVGAYFVADISHIAGLIAGGVHPSPVDFADVIMTTTHKTLRGPRGAIIMVTEKGLAKDPFLAEKIDKAVFPGLQGGPHMETVAGLAVALKEAGSLEFKAYAKQVVKNAQTIASELLNRDYDLVGGGTENHMLIVDLRNKEIDGWMAAWVLEGAGIVANRQVVPNDPGSSYYPSGLRLGTPALTTRGMKEVEMEKIAGWIDEAIQVIRNEKWEDIGSEDREKDQSARKRFKSEIAGNPSILKLRKSVAEMCKKFPLDRI